MAKVHSRFPSLSFCRTKSRLLRIRLPSIRAKPVSHSLEMGSWDDRQESILSSSGEVKDGYEIGNKIMVYVDQSIEAKSALEWALSHTVQNQDTIILLHVAYPSKKLGSNGKHDLKDCEFLHSMKRMCQLRRPGVQVEVSVVEGKEKGETIVKEAKQQRVQMLVLGRRRRLKMWRRLIAWGRSRRSKSVVDYCIQNADCMAIAVRRKSRKLGGYLITTKRHKNFWLLA